ncbi:2Fe-2S iron-sulfur cluster-binding protein [Niallia oryzisoli]|uniref:2Fe-2S iron-sulfur cluster-binding protein n=1 Tax=Niallia oryzisoli TaxID=1737571 RepID=A0ABZ2CK57_9BACI
MPYLTVLGKGTFEVDRGKKLVLALEDNDVHILHHCGGHAKCTTCRVEILAGEYFELTDKEKTAFESKDINYEVFDDFLRLSCQICVTGDLTVRPIMTVENSGLTAGPRPAD